MKLRDAIWMWGHPAGSHNTGWGLPRTSRMTPAEGAYYLGARNMMMVCYGDQPQPPFEREALSFDPFRQVIWSVVGNGTCGNHTESLGNLEEILRLAQTHPNLTGGIFDDFFQEGRDIAYPPEKLREVRRRLHSAPRPLDLWVVLYDHQLNQPIQEHLRYIDGVTFWTWLGKDIERFEENFQRLKQVAAGKRVLLGCYLYNYGECREMPRSQMEFQLGRYAEKVCRGEAEGIILLSNNVVDLQFEAVEYAREWIRANGDKTISTQEGQAKAWR